MHQHRILSLIFLAAISTLLASIGTSFAAELSKPDSISVAYCRDCAPFQFQNEKGEADGMVIDQWRLWVQEDRNSHRFRTGALGPNLGAYT